MKFSIKSLFRFEMIIIILVFTAYSLTWISWGKLIVSGWNVPILYKKTTQISNIILFFSKKDAQHMGYILYVVPALGILSAFFLIFIRSKFSGLLLWLTCLCGILVSLYMYYYFLSSKIFKLANAGYGVHLLCFSSIAGLIFLYNRNLKTKNERTKNTADDISTNTSPVF